MNAIFRCDASLDIGTGHVIRCLTLADEMRHRGFECWFICRELPGNLISLIRERGYEAMILPVTEAEKPLTGYGQWLTVSIEQDASQTIDILDRMKPMDWLIVDHYAIDVEWEQLVAAHVKQIMVIDDLANRHHHCEIILDQTFGRREEDYLSLVSGQPRFLCGAQYSLLRPAFQGAREHSLSRRETAGLNHILVSLGGVDRDNATAKVLQILERSSLASDIKITVVMGRSAPWIAEVQELAQASRFRCLVRAGVDDMAELMSQADLAIGAVGATAWERCAVGLPSLVTVLAENQVYALQQLQRSGAVMAFTLDSGAPESLNTLIQLLTARPELISEMSAKAACVTDGAGCAKVADVLVSGEFI